MPVTGESETVKFAGMVARVAIAMLLVAPDGRLSRGFHPRNANITIRVGKMENPSRQVLWLIRTMPRIQQGRQVMRIPMLCVLMLGVSVTDAADSPREPMVVLNALADQIYVAGETSGKAADMVAAEEKAADEVRQYIRGGSTKGLLPREKGTQSPLAAAAYMGYPNVVAALLTSKLVLAHINDADAMGLTPWIAANMSMKQSAWTCNPTVFEDPFKFVPMLVTQPYYLSGEVPPYKRVRIVLENAGASSDMTKAKNFWLTNCKGQSEEARTRVQASTDLQKTVQERGAADLTSQLMRLQKKAAESQGTH